MWPCALSSARLRYPGTMPERHDESPATRLGHSVGRLRRKLRQSQPRAEKTARGAIDAARPAAERAGQFLQEHEDEIKRAGAAGARIVVNRAAPPALRPVVSAMDRELFKNAAKQKQDDADHPDGPPDERAHSAGANDDIV